MKIETKNSVRRQALIIQNPGIAKDFRSGVLKDAIHFSEFLQSNIGGGWESEEITIAPHDCTLSWIGDYFEQTFGNTDYYLILFTGHGDFDEQIGPRCYLLNGEWFSHVWLEQQVSGVPTLFLTDSCQGIEKMNEGGTLRQKNFSSTVDLSRRSLYREKYDSVLSNLPQDMFVVGSSVRPGEYAGENPNEGGYYVISLISEAKKINQDSSAKSGIYGIGYIHMLATDRVKTMSKDRQTPYLTGYNRSFQPPFMVKL